MPKSSDFDKEDFEYTEVKVTGQVPVVLYDNYNVTSSTLFAKQDLAWANITEEKASPIIKMIGDVGDIRDPYLGEFVQFYGGMSKDCCNNLKIVGVSVKCGAIFNINKTKKFGFFEHVKFEITQAAVIPRDSGSAIIAQSDKIEILGILMASTLLYRYFIKLTF